MNPRGEPISLLVTDVEMEDHVLCKKKQIKIKPFPFPFPPGLGQ
jgi:hypothetical protein